MTFELNGFRDTAQVNSELETPFTRYEDPDNAEDNDEATVQAELAESIATDGRPVSTVLEDPEGVPSLWMPAVGQSVVSETVTFAAESERELPKEIIKVSDSVTPPKAGEESSSSSSPAADSAATPEAGAGSGGAGRPPLPPDGGNGSSDESGEEPEGSDKTPETAKAPTMNAIEIAGALQGVIADIANRDFDLDMVQEETVKAIGEKIIAGETEGHIDSATSSGKTLQIALLAEAAVKAGKRVHIMAPSKPIADQIIGADGKTGIGRFTKLLEEVVVTQNYDGRHGDAQSPVVVSTYAGFLNEAKAIKENGGRLGEFGVILGDECHRSLGDITSKALYSYMPEAVKVGFSATPDYAEDRKSEEIWGERWFEFSLRSSIEVGKTAPTRSLLISTDATLSLDDPRSEFTERELAPLIDNFERNGIALRMSQDFVNAGRQGIIACVPGRGNAHATIMAELLSQMETGDRTIVAKDIGSHLHPDEQRRRLEDYREGKIDILTFTRAIEEGWDSEQASFCLNLAPTTSEVRTKQLMGRIGRVKASGLESIYVDFLDDKIGVNKQQYTAAHALELDDIDLDRVLGWGNASEKTSPPDLRPILRPEIYERLLRVQGKTLLDALVSKSGSPIDPLVAQWEGTLKREGLPEELPENPVFPTILAKKYEQAAEMLRRQNGVEPTSDEIADFLVERRIPKNQEQAVREFGTRIDWPDTLAKIPDDMHESVEDIVMRLALSDALDKAMSDLDEREVKVVRARFGLGLADETDPEKRDEERDELIKLSRQSPLTLDQIGIVLGVRRERVRQIESKAMAKLRHISRSGLMTDFVQEYSSENRQALPPWATTTRKSESAQSPSLFPSLPGAGVPVRDPRDHRPYLTRVQETARAAADGWLKAKKAKLSQFRKEVLESSEDYLKTLAAHASPSGYFLNGQYYSREAVANPGYMKRAAKIYDFNELRAFRLRAYNVPIDEELQPLLALRERIMSRGIDSQHRESREATLTVVNERIRALQAYRHEINKQIKEYVDASRTRPQRFRL
ncbi:MAG TPA: DEAD/DEAH box helicase family protein [Candidatus Saccharimonadales bacterium]|nr:DEAD/DEAH box helicase family protein [Candidatus Saccharimonadales bacterium]